MERYSPVFWLAVAVLASRVLLEFSRGAAFLLDRAAARMLGPSLAVTLVPTSVEGGPTPAPPGEPLSDPTPPGPVLLETMSHDEMDRLLQPWT